MKKIGIAGCMLIIVLTVFVLMIMLLWAGETGEASPWWIDKQQYKDSTGDGPIWHLPKLRQKQGRHWGQCFKDEWCRACIADGEDVDFCFAASKLRLHRRRMWFEEA